MSVSARFCPCLKCFVSVTGVGSKFLLSEIGSVFNNVFSATSLHHSLENSKFTYVWSFSEAVKCLKVSYARIAPLTVTYEFEIARCQFQFRIGKDDIFGVDVWTDPTATSNFSSCLSTPAPCRSHQYFYTNILSFNHEFLIPS